MGAVATCPCYGLCSVRAGLGVSGTTHPGHPRGRTPAPRPGSVEFLLELASVAHCLFPRAPSSCPEPMPSGRVPATAQLMPVTSLPGRR